MMAAVPFKKLLVIIDGSAAGDSGLDVALRLAPTASASLIVATVSEPIVVSGGDATVAEVLQEHRAARRTAEGQLDLARARLEGCSVKAQFKLLEGAGRSVIVSAAEQLGADLIVLGAEEHGLWACGLKGCTACWVTKNAPCSVLVVRCREDAGDASSAPVVTLPEPCRT
jgi:nucleotide-binding universal stress UspA family protein